MTETSIEGLYDFPGDTPYTVKFTHAEMFTLDADLRRSFNVQSVVYSGEYSQIDWASKWDTWRLNPAWWANEKTLKLRELIDIDRGFCNVSNKRVGTNDISVRKVACYRSGSEVCINSESKEIENASLKAVKELLYDDAFLKYDVINRDVPGAEMIIAAFYEDCFQSNNCPGMQQGLEF